MLPKELSFSKLWNILALSELHQTKFDRYEWFEQKTKERIRAVRQICNMLNILDILVLIITKVRLLILIRMLLDGCIRGVTPKGYLIIHYHIGSGVNKITNVCRDAFIFANQISESYLQGLCKYIKQRKFNVVANFSDRSSSVKCDESAIAKKTEKLQLLARQMNFTLSSDQLAAMMMPNKSKYIFAYAWMKRFFELIGDSEPNADEIHVEPISIEEVYQEYLKDNQRCYAPQEFASKKQIAKLWLLCFP